MTERAVLTATGKEAPESTFVSRLVRSVTPQPTVAPRELWSTSPPMGTSRDEYWCRRALDTEARVNALQALYADAIGAQENPYYVG